MYLWSNIRKVKTDKRRSEAKATIKVVGSRPLNYCFENKDAPFIDKQKNYMTKVTGRM